MGGKNRTFVSYICSLVANGQGPFIFIIFTIIKFKIKLVSIPTSIPEVFTDRVHHVPVKARSMRLPIAYISENVVVDAWFMG